MAMLILGILGGGSYLRRGWVWYVVSHNWSESSEVAQLEQDVPFILALEGHSQFRANLSGGIKHLLRWDASFVDMHLHWAGLLHERCEGR